MNTTYSSQHGFDPNLANMDLTRARQVTSTVLVYTAWTWQHGFETSCATHIKRYFYCYIYIYMNTATWAWLEQCTHITTIFTTWTDISPFMHAGALSFYADLRDPIVSHQRKSETRQGFQRNWRNSKEKTITVRAPIKTVEGIDGVLKREQVLSDSLSKHSKKSTGSQRESKHCPRPCQNDKYLVHKRSLHQTSEACNLGVAGRMRCEPRNPPDLQPMPGPLHRWIS